MKRAFIMVLDSFGIGATEDAERFGDVGADTLGHIAEACAKGEADNGRKGPLNLPNLTRLGLAKAHEGSTGFIPAGMDGNAEVIGAYAWAHEMSSGKDTPSGHWEIAGVPVLFEWGYFSDHENSFPQELLDKLVERANLPGYLGNCHSSGTVILDQLGEEHMKTGKPIFYTSADLKVFEAAVQRFTQVRSRIRGREMHVKSHVCQPDGDSRCHRGFTYATFAHQHNQAVLTASNIIDQARER